MFSATRERIRADILTSTYIFQSPYEYMTLYMLHTCSIGFRPIWPIIPLTKI